MGTYIGILHALRWALSYLDISNNLQISNCMKWAHFFDVISKTFENVWVLIVRPRDQVWARFPHSMTRGWNFCESWFTRRPFFTPFYFKIGGNSMMDVIKNSVHKKPYFRHFRKNVHIKQIICLKTMFHQFPLIRQNANFDTKFEN